MLKCGIRCGVLVLGLGGRRRVLGRGLLFEGV